MLDLLHPLDRGVRTSGATRFRWSGRTRRNARVQRLAVVAGVVLTALLGFPAAASAHADLLSSDPSDGAVVDTAPSRIVLTFNEPISPIPSGVQVVDPAGKTVRTGPAGRAGHDQRTVAVMLPSGLGKGTYAVAWRVTSADSHPVHGAFVFAIGQPSATTPVATGDADDAFVNVLIGVARELTFAGFVLMVGAMVVLLACWPAGTPPAPLRRLAVIGWATLFAASLVHALLQGPYAAGQSLAHVFDGDDLSATVGSRLGQALMIRIGLLGLFSGFADPLFERVPALAGRRRAVAVAAGGLVAATLAATWSMSGHASTGPQVLLGVVADTVHLTAIAAWLGGLVALALMLWAPGVDRRDLARALARFSPLALGCVVALVVTGTYQGWRQVGSLNALADSGYGQILLVKLAVFVVLLGAAAASRRWLRVGAAGAPGAAPNGRGVPDPSRLRRSVATEAGLGAVVLAVTAVLVGTAPGRSDGDEHMHEAAHFSSTSAGSMLDPSTGTGQFSLGGNRGNGTVALALQPAHRGLNTMNVAVAGRNNGPLTVQELRITLSQGDLGPLTVHLTRTGNDLYLGTNVVLPRTGTWVASVTVRTTAVDEATVRIELTVR